MARASGTASATYASAVGTVKNDVNRTPRESSSRNACSRPAWWSRASWGSIARAIGHVTIGRGEDEEAERELEGNQPAAQPVGDHEDREDLDRLEPGERERRHDPADHDADLRVAPARAGHEREARVARPEPDGRRVDAHRCRRAQPQEEQLGVGHACPRPRRCRRSGRPRTSVRDDADVLQRRRPRGQREPTRARSERRRSPRPPGTGGSGARTAPAGSSARAAGPPPPRPPARPG